MSTSTSFAFSYSLRQAEFADAASIGRIHVAAWQESYAHIFPANYLQQLDEEKKTLFWQQFLQSPSGERPVYVLIDEIEGKIIGFCSGEVQQQGLFEVTTLYLRQSEQGQGLAEYMFRVLVSYAKGRDCEKVTLETYAASASSKFYQKLGGQVIREYEEKEAGTTACIQQFQWVHLPSVALRLFHIYDEDCWRHAKATHANYSPPTFSEEKFIHLSFQRQLSGTMQKWFPGETHLGLLELEPLEFVQNIRLEKNDKTAELFPHLYKELSLDSVMRALPASSVVS